MRCLIVLSISMLVACSPGEYRNGPLPRAWNDPGSMGMGGGQPRLTLPFVSGQYWIVTQSYNTGSHQDYNFSYGDDSYAIDFSQSGCNAYGKEVTPIAGGTVLESSPEGSSGDHGYGNNVLIDHGDGFVSRYGHLSQLLVSEGDDLSSYDALGLVGNTGYSSGSACESHPGTHLHVAFYWNGEAQKPEPMSGVEHMQTGCWYNREGEENCSGDPGPYEPVDGGEDSGGNGNYDNGLIRLLQVSPSEGTPDETEFTWVTVVDTPEEPDVTLMINNPNDDVDYNFEMYTQSNESPWVFTFQKTLRDPNSSYRYWVEVESEEGYSQSDSDRVVVNGHSSDVPEFVYLSRDPGSGEADETEFSWEARVDSHDEPEVSLCIVNASDAELYRFSMDVRNSGGDWFADYQKTLRDPSVYTYWMEAVNGASGNTSPVQSIVVY